MAMPAGPRQIWKVVGRYRVATVVVGLLSLTWAAEQLHIRYLHRESPQALLRVVSTAERHIATRFDAMQAAMLKHAAALAADPVVVAGLSGSSDTGPLVRHLARDRLPARWSVGAYDRAGTLMAWNGVSIPPEAGSVPESSEIHWGLATDGSWRQALELWYPVPGTLGHVRLLQLLYERTPVQNEYLRDFRVGDEWSLLVGLPVRTSFDKQQRVRDGKPLAARDGTVVGHFDLAVPELDFLVADVKRRYRDAMALWIAFLLGIGLWGLWRRYRSQRTWMWLGAFAISWWGVRYVLLLIDVPGRWQTGKAPLSPLFDATHLASTLGGGLLRSTGDLLVSALFFLFVALVLLRFAHHHYGASPGVASTWRHLRRSPLQVLRTLIAAAASLGLVALLGTVVRHAVLDSTVDFLSREALLPEPLILAIFCALAITALAVVLAIAGILRIAIGPAKRYEEVRPGESARYLAGALLALAVLVAVADVRIALPWIISVAFLGVGFAAAFLRVGSSLDWLTLRSVLLVTLVVSTLLYPLLVAGFNERRHSRMEHAAASFDRGYDQSVAFALRDLLEEARTDTTLAAGFAMDYGDLLAAAAMDPSHGTLLSSRGAFDLDLHFFGPSFAPLGSAAGDTAHLVQRIKTLRRGVDDSDTVILPAADAELGHAYEGATSVFSDGKQVGWILARVAPQVLPEEASTPLLRILLSSGYRDLYASLSIGSFRDGLLQHSIGRSFRHYALDRAVAKALQDTSTVWRLDKYGDRTYEAYYLRHGDGNVVGVRAATVAVFDHLYYLLRLIVAGLGIGLPLYLVGLVLRRSARMLPAKHVRFQDKVLNAFLAMAIIAVIPVGIVGVRVVTEENTKAIQSWLRNHLQLVEVTLASESRGDEAPYRVLERVSIDSLAARLGLDLNLYDEQHLVASSRNRLVQERLIDVRLPIQAYEALFLDGYKSTFVVQQLGDFSYTAGYHVLLDEGGSPRYVLSVPTLPEQERIEEERARTLAYLFGALLALMTLVMLTASLLASALARPIARLQQGLQAVAQGRFERRLPVQTRDEVGQLAQTFNDMQRQLAENRRQLTQQERKLAWREMARQVAHEIKNPLTPMKLSVQHLQQAYETRTPGDEKGFGGLFHRITKTLVQEIGALAHIANEFASFARMPDRIVEHLDLVEVIREATSLMQEEAKGGVAFSVQLPQDSLVVQADRKELKRIYVNLIKNALEAMQEDATGVITITARRDGGVAYSAVSDTGCGIAPDLQEKIFEPRFSTKTSGTGLGLAIARRSIEAFGGTIGFDSQDSGGSVFYIRLPLSS